MCPSATFLVGRALCSNFQPLICFCFSLLRFALLRFAFFASPRHLLVVYHSQWCFTVSFRGDCEWQTLPSTASVEKRQALDVFVHRWHLDHYVVQADIATRDEDKSVQHLSFLYGVRVPNAFASWNVAFSIRQNQHGAVKPVIMILRPSTCSLITELRAQVLLHGGGVAGVPPDHECSRRPVYAGHAGTGETQPELHSAMFMMCTYPT